jgi:predicted membrane protein
VRKIDVRPVTSDPETIRTIRPADRGGVIVANTVLTDTLSEPLHGATTATLDVNSGTGNLTIDRLTGGEPLLATGTLQYVEVRPIRWVCSDDDQIVLALDGHDTGRPWLSFPWIRHKGVTEWQIHLNPAVSSDITAHSDGGNIKLDLDGMIVTHLAADTGGGNVDVALPDRVANLHVAAMTGAGNVTVEIGSSTTGHNTVEARSGAGNVIVRLPRDIAGRVQASSGLGRVTVDPRFSKIDRTMYQSADYEGARNTVEITVNSGAGNVSVDTK